MKKQTTLFSAIFPDFEILEFFLLIIFFRPTSFDALLFAYLAPLVKANLANTKLQNHVKACENLVKFVGRIITRYFPPETKDPVQEQGIVF